MVVGMKTVLEQNGCYQLLLVNHHILALVVPRIGYDIAGEGVKNHSFSYQFSFEEGPSVGCRQKFDK